MAPPYSISDIKSVEILLNSILLISITEDPKLLIENAPPN